MGAREVAMLATAFKEGMKILAGSIKYAADTYYETEKLKASPGGGTNWWTRDSSGGPA